jgi:hypothetical protein
MGRLRTLLPAAAPARKARNAAELDAADRGVIAPLCIYGG